MEYSHSFDKPDSSTALPDSLHRMTQSASRQQMMDGLQTRLKKDNGNSQQQPMN